MLAAARTAPLDGTDNDVRLEALRLLGAIGPVANAAASARVARMVDNQLGPLRLEAARTLLLLTRDAQHLFAAYLAAVRNRDPQVRQLLAPAMRALSPEAAGKLTPRLVELSQRDPDAGVRRHAPVTLEMMRPKPVRRRRTMQACSTRGSSDLADQSAVRFFTSSRAACR